MCALLISDITTQSLGAALRGLDAQRQAHEFNISNVETPGFRAREVDFATSLRKAINDGNPLKAGVDESLSIAPTRFDGNNVRLDHEITALEENGLHQQLVTEALNAQYRLLRTTWS
jgi:flagellar basal-body rod protein FlgB